MDGDPPTGTVTFLFTDIEGSTPLWERAPEKMAEAERIHNQALRQAIEGNRGIVFQIVGDAFMAAFAAAPQALQAAIDGQRGLKAARWNELGQIRVRMGLHSGPAELDAQGASLYAASHTLNRAARVMSAGAGGQILISQETYELARRNLPEGCSLKDLGEQRLKGMIQLEHLYQAVVADLPADFPRLATSISRPNNLPVRLTSFIGRKREIEAICQQLTDPEARMLTITGVGGTGKTSLAIQAGRELLEAFEDGVFFVDLAPTKEAGLVIPAIAQVLSIHELPGEPLRKVLEEHLRQRKLLLILDNFEQVLAAGAELVRLLEAAPGLKILATSREHLHISPEHDFSLPPMQLPDPHNTPESLQANEAVRLFVERARAVRPDFQLTAENGGQIVEICRRLDGLPLAIELIAARLRLVNLPQLMQQLSNQLRLLAGGWRDAPPRHQTMRAAIAWSFELLRDDEKKVFYRLAVFPGSFSLEAAEAICGEGGLDVLLAMESLLDKHLVNRTEAASRPRLWCFETVREFGLEQMAASGEENALRRAHAVYYAELLDKSWSNFGFLNYALWDRERYNLREAFNWAIENQDGELCFKMGAVFFIWERQVDEGRQLISRALRLPNLQARTFQRGRLLYSAGALALFVRDFPAATVSIDEMGEIYQELGDPYRIWEHRFIRGVLLSATGQYQEAIELLVDGKDQLIDFDYGLTSLGIATCELLLQRLGEAKISTEQAQAHLIQAGEGTRPYLVDCLCLQGYIALEEALPGEAERYFGKAFRLALDSSVPTRAAVIYYGLGRAAMMRGDLVEGVNWMSLAVTIQKTAGSTSRFMPDGLQRCYLNELKSRLAPETFEAEWKAGQRLSLEEAIAYGEERLSEGR